MDFKGFKPFIDGLKITQQEHLHQFQTQPGPAFLEEAKSEIISFIKQNYPGAITAYEIEPWLNAWSNISMDSPGILDVGFYYMIMDFYYAKKVIPRKFKNPQSKRALNFQSYLEKRTTEGLKIKTINQLKAVITSRLMPDSWIGEFDIAGKIKEEIQSIGYYSNIKIDFDLQIPKSGKNWLRHRMILEWEKLRKALDKGRPEIITYIICKGKYAHIDRTVIAYAYKIDKQKNMEISIYDLAESDRASHITINLDQNRRMATEDISSLYIEDYEPYHIENSLAPGRIFSIVSFPIWWYLRRIYKLLVYLIFRQNRTS